MHKAGYERWRRGTGQRVFLSHTSELQKFPADRSFVAAAAAAISRIGHVVVEMDYFAAGDTTPADHCISQVATTDIYVGLIGLRYGSIVPDRPELSYTELEFETATRLGLKRLVFLLDENAALPIPFSELHDVEHGPRQEEFRRRLQKESALSVGRVASPIELERSVYQALVELATVAGDPVGRPDDGASLPADDFLERVAEVCRLRLTGAQVTRVASGEGPTAYLRVTESGEVAARQHAVGALPGGVTRADLERFAADVHDRYREDDPQVTSWLVYGGERAPGDLIRDARQRGIRLVSFVEYQGLVDLRAYVETVGRRLRLDPRYPPERYVPQRYTLLEGGDGSVQPELLRDVLDWLAAPQGRVVLVLGDFGIGKSFLTRELFHRIPQALPDLVPMLVQIGTLQQVGSLDELLAQHLASAGETVIDLRAIRYMLREGRIALLFDGYDELAQRVTYDRAAEHLGTLLEAAEGRAKVVITSRSQYFRTDKEVVTALGAQLEDLPGRRLVQLRELDEPQIREFLARFCEDETAAAQRFALVRDVRDLLGLSRNPRMLSFIAALEEQQLTAVRRRHGAISAAELYRELLRRWLEHEQERSEPRGGLPSLPRPQRWEAARRLALELWRRRGAGLQLSELTAAVAAAVEQLPALRMDADQVVHAVGSGTLLVRDQDGTFSFLHRSVCEWLVASAAAEMVAGGAEPEMLREAEMSTLMAEFFCDLAGREAALAWARREYTEPAGDVSAANALMVLGRLDARPAEAAGLAGRDLRGTDLARQSLQRADLTGADLREAVLIEASLEGAVLREASLRGARLDGANLRNADLTGADLTGARLLGADLRGAVTDQAIWRRAALVGARLDDGALDHMDAWGAAPPEAVAVEAEVARVDAACTAVGFAGGGELIASGHADGTLRLWDVDSARPLRAVEAHVGPVRSLAFGPDGRWLASAGGDGAVRRWELESGRQVAGLVDPDGPVWCVAVGPDGLWLATAGDDGSVRRWEVESGRLLQVLDAHRGPARCVAVGREGAWLVSGGDDGAIRVWDVATSLLLRTLSGHSGAVAGLAISPDGRWLASAGSDWTLRLWEAETGICLHILRGHMGPVTSVTIEPDGTWLASAGLDRTVRLWGADGAALRSLEGHGAPVRSVAVSRDGACVASAGDDRVVTFWEVGSGRPLRSTPEGRGRPLSSLAIGANGRWLAAAGDDRVALWEIETGRRLSVLESRASSLRSVAIGPGGAWLAAAGADGAVTLWETATGLPLRSLVGHTSSVWSVAISPDGTWLASAGYGGVVRLWQVETGRVLRVLAGHPSSVLSVAISPDGSWLASAGADRVIRRWEARTGAPLQVLEGLQGTVLSVAIGPDGSWLASGGDDGAVRLWEVSASRLPRVLKGHAGPVRSVVISRDGSWLASAGDDGVIRTWDSASGLLLAELPSRAGPMRSVAIGLDGTCLASAGADGVVRLWDVESGRQMATLVSLQEGWACLLPDGGYKLQGIAAGAFWHLAGLCRFEPGELDEYLPSLRHLPATARIRP